MFSRPTMAPSMVHYRSLLHGGAGVLFWTSLATCLCGLWIAPPRPAVPWLAIVGAGLMALSCVTLGISASVALVDLRMRLMGKRAAFWAGAIVASCGLGVGIWWFGWGRKRLMDSIQEASVRPGYVPPPSVSELIAEISAERPSPIPALPPQMAIHAPLFEPMVDPAIETVAVPPRPVAVFAPSFQDAPTTLNTEPVRVFPRTRPAMPVLRAPLHAAREGQLAPTIGLRISRPKRPHG